MKAGKRLVNFLREKNLICNAKLIVGGSGLEMPPVMKVQRNLLKLAKEIITSNILEWKNV